MVVDPECSDIGIDKPWSTLFFEWQGLLGFFPFQTRFLTQENRKLA